VESLADAQLGHKHSPILIGVRWARECRQNQAEGEQSQTFVHEGLFVAGAAAWITYFSAALKCLSKNSMVA
jgi:hypothetical protein